MSGQSGNCANWGRQYQQSPIVNLKSQIPKGYKTRTRAIPSHFRQNDWVQPSLPSGLPRVAAESPEILEPVQRIFERLGSNTNLSRFTLLQNPVSAVKNSLETFKRPVSPQVFDVQIALALAGDELGIKGIMAGLREVS
jgi:hypothetical protein